MTARTVEVGSGPHSAARYGLGWAVVGVDVFRATTVICTATSAGRQCHVATDLAEARAIVARTPGALLGGEQGGHVPPAFDVGNSPAGIAGRTDIDRPLVLLTSSGTPLLRHASGASAVYAACLRNVSAQVHRLRGLDLDVAVIAAGTGGHPREEDDLGCARIAAGLIAAGFCGDESTRAFVEEYSSRRTEWAASGRSARFLQSVGRQDDIDFVLSHVDDLESVVEVRGTEAIPESWSIPHAH